MDCNYKNTLISPIFKHPLVTAIRYSVRVCKEKKVNEMGRIASRTVKNN